MRHNIMLVQIWQKLESIQFLAKKLSQYQNYIKNTLTIFKEHYPLITALFKLQNGVVIAFDILNT